MEPLTQQEINSILEESLEKQKMLTKEELEKDEPLLQVDTERLSFFPILYPSVYQYYNMHLASFWKAEEIDLAQDMTDWNTKLTTQEQFFIKQVLAFFAASDGIVFENICGKFSKDVKIPEARSFYNIQAAMENIHSETYSLLIDTYIKDQNEKKNLFNAISTVEVIKMKAEWAIKWMNSGLSFQERAVAFAAVEGIFFSGSFCAIFWLKKRNLMPGLAFSNELISRDQGLHTEFAVHLYSLMNKKLPNERIQEIISSAVDIEKQFVTLALSSDLLGINSRLMTQYIEFVADRLVFILGAPKIYNAKNPFDWMNLISMEGKTNFFEKRVGEYQKAGVMSKEKGCKFVLDEEY